jgi:LuxR family maltose regulon positive regulatory protein
MQDDFPITLPGGDANDVLESFFASVPSSAPPLRFVIDDAHVLNHPKVLAGLDAVVRGWYPRLRLVLAARSDPLLPLHRYRLAGQLCELRASDLAMTQPEARALLAVHGVQLPEPAFELLAARTEGWTAGLRLSAIRMAGTESPADFVAELAVDQGSIGEYLIDEVIDRQPKQVRQVLVQTGFLRELTGPMADAITGIEDCADILLNLARSNSFVIPLDSAQSRFRYHQLLAEILQYLMRRTPRLAATRFRRASAWYETHGDLHNALKWALHAGDLSHVTSLLARGGLARTYVQRDDLSSSGLLDDLQLPTPNDADEARSAETRVARVAITALMADRQTATQELAHFSRFPLTDRALQATCDLAELILAEKTGNALITEAAAQRVLSNERDGGSPRVPALRACALLASAQARFWEGNYDDVEATLQEALVAAVHDEAPAVELEVLGMTAFVNAYWSRHNRAEAAARRAREIQSASVEFTTPLTLELADAFRGFVAADFTVMARAIRQALASPLVEWNANLATVLSVLQAQLLLACGQYVEARIVLQGVATPEASAPAMLRANRDMMLASIETALGRPHAALRLLQSYRHTSFAALLAVTRARAYLALGDVRNAQACVRTVLTGASEQVGRYLLIEAILCDAQIAEVRRESARALEMLVRAIEIAGGDIILPFVCCADVFAELLARHSAVAAQWPKAAGAPAPQPQNETIALAVRHLPEPLTDRERAVLRFLATSMSTVEIADELCLSVNTVKTHLAAIYRKLAARRRRDAVLRAREFELL